MGFGRKKSEDNKGGTPPKKGKTDKKGGTPPKKVKTVAPKVTGTGPNTHTYSIYSTKPGHSLLRREGCNCNLGKSHSAYETPPEPNNG